MVAASVNKKQVGRSAVAALLAVALIAGGIGLFRRWRETRNEQAGIPGATAEEREAYLNSLGYEVDEKSTVAEVGVPDSFDARFSEYNEMLRGMGFDLEPLRGKAVKKCSYTVTAGATRSGNLMAVLLVYDGEVVGGHLLDPALQRIYPLFENAAEETLIGSELEILPSSAAVGGEGEPLAEAGADAAHASDAAQTAAAGDWPSD